MSQDRFDQQLEVARQRLKTLETLAAGSADARTIALETLAELSTALEELNVLTEELRQQNDELLSTRQMVEAERRRYLDLFELAPDGYLVTDLDGIIQEANRAAATLLEASQTALVGTSAAALVADGERAAFEVELNRVKGGVAPAADWQVVFTRRTGSPVPVSLTVGPMRDELGRLRGLRWLVRDITERRRMEEQLRASQGQLRTLAAHLESIREEEHARIAKAVHDELGQNLAALNADLYWMVGRLPGERTDLLEKTRQMSGLLRTTIDSSRRIFTELHSAILEDLGLLAALEQQAQEFTTQTGIACRFTSPIQTLTLDPARSTVLFRICQEILGHVARCARATMVRIGLEQQGARLILTVESRGTGITERESAAADTLELTRLRERALALGGTASIVDRPGVSITVTVAIPLAPPRRETP
ncbi:MAG: PAS domain S-box protein [Candidatus Methylomirabilis oxyfera]|nr:PAS domain S-box protein [Candidatus Methylomirabilis oxyfera]